MATMPPLEEELGEALNLGDLAILQRATSSTRRGSLAIAIGTRLHPWLENYATSNGKERATCARDYASSAKNLLSVSQELIFAVRWGIELRCEHEHARAPGR